MTEIKSYQYHSLSADEINELYDIYSNSDDYSKRRRAQLILLWNKDYSLNQISDILHFQADDEYPLIYYKAYRYGGFQWLFNDDIDFLKSLIAEIEYVPPKEPYRVLTFLIKAFGFILFIFTLPFLIPMQVINWLSTLNWNKEDKTFNLKINPKFKWLPNVIEFIIFPLILISLIFISPFLLLIYYLNEIDFSIQKREVSKNQPAILINISDSKDVNLKFENQHNNKTEAYINKNESFVKNVKNVESSLNKNKDKHIDSNNHFVKILLKIFRFNIRTINSRFVTYAISFLIVLILYKSKILTLFASWVCLGFIFTFTGNGCEVKRDNSINRQESIVNIKNQMTKDSLLNDVKLDKIDDSTFIPDNDFCSYRSVMGIVQDSIVNNDSVNHQDENYYVKSYDNRYYIYVVTYSNLSKAALQRNYIRKNGFTHAKILPSRTNKGIEYRVTIFDFKEDNLLKAGQWQKLWDSNCKDESAKSHLVLHSYR